MRTRHLVLATLVMLTMAPFLSLGLPADTGQRSDDPWFVQGLALERQAIFDMAVGEVDPSSPGLEFVVTGGAGIVSMYSSETFEQESLFAALKTQQAVDIGDVYSGAPGSEVVTVGTDWKVHLIMRQSDGSWKGQTIWESKGSLNGVTIGEFNASHQGLEIAAVGDEAILAIINEDKGVAGGWAVTSMPVQSIPITNMMATSAELLPGSPGDEILVGSFSGDAFLAKHDAQGVWNITSIYRDEYAILAFGTGQDLVPDITSPEIYIGTFGGKVVLASHNGTNWTTEVIYRDKQEQALYGVVPGDIDPRYPGAEIVVCGISDDVHVIRYGNGTWHDEAIKNGMFTLLYDIKVAELDSEHPGLETIIGGFNQDLIELAYFEPGFDLAPLIEETTVVSGQDAHLWVLVDAIGNFDGEVTLSSDTDAVLTPSKAYPGDVVRITVPTSASGTSSTRTVTVKGVHQSIEATAQLKVTTAPSAEPGLEIEVTPASQTTVPGFPTTFMVRPTILNSWYPSVQYSVRDEGDLEVDVTNDPSDPEGPALLTVTPPTWAGSQTRHLEIEATGIDGQRTFTTSAIATLVVDARGQPDFTLQVDPTNAIGPYASVLRYELTINPLYDFDEEVVLSVDGIPEGSAGSFSAQVVTLPAKVDFVLALGTVNFSEVRVLEFTAQGGGMVHKAVSSLLHIGTSYSFDFYPKVLPSVQVASPGSTIQYLVHVWGYGDIYEFKVDTDDGPFRATVRPGLDGNPEYRLLEVEVDRNAIPGRYKAYVLAQGQWERQAPFEVVVDQANDVVLELGSDEMTCMKDFSLWLPGVDGCSIMFTDLGGPEGQMDYVFLGLRPTDEGYVPNETLYGHSNWYFDPRDHQMSLPVPDEELRGVRPGYDYHALFIVKPTDSPYPKAKVLTVHIIEQMPIITCGNLDVRGTFREGSTMKVGFMLDNRGPIEAEDVSIELFIDGKLMGQTVADSVPQGQYPYFELEWEAVGGKHNVTVVIGDSATGQEIMVPERTYEQEVTIYKNRFDGPAISIVLILMMIGLAMAMRTSTTKERARPRTRPGVRDEEE